MCGHSFNLRSLGENDRECPLCAPDFKRVQEIRRNMRAGEAAGGVGRYAGSLAACVRRQPVLFINGTTPRRCVLTC